VKLSVFKWVYYLIIFESLTSVILMIGPF
jgi:hypothetical protein